MYFGCLGQSVTQSDQHQVMSSVGNLSASFISSPLKQRGKAMNFQAIRWFYDNETLPLTSGQKFCLLSQATSFVTYACDFAAVCPRLFCDTSHLMSLRFYLIRVSILALIRYNAPRSVSEPVGIRPILTALRTGLVYRSTPVMRYVVIRLCYHLLGRHTAYYRSCVPLGLIGRK